MRLPRRVALFCLMGVLALGVVLVIALGSSNGSHQPTPGEAQGPASPTGFDGALLSPAPSPYDFTLADQRGRRVSLSDYRGQVVLLTFLSTASASASTSRLMAQQIRGALEDLDTPPPTLAVSVDPRADTPPRVRALLRRVSLTGRLEYLTGTVTELRAVWHAYQITPPDRSSRSANRSAYVLLIDRHGAQRVRFYVEQLTPEGLAHDIRKLQAG